MVQSGNIHGVWLRRVIGVLVLAFVWGSYLARILWGIGPMHDLQGNQAPATHYLAGAVVGTVLVAVWILSREWWQPRSQN